MIFLVLSVVLSSLLFVSFKWFNLKKVNLQAAVAGNYMACILVGILMGLSDQSGYKPYPSTLILTCLALGILFFIVLYGMGYASAHIGVGIASASTKMSLVIPVVYAALVLHEPFGTPRIAALLCALAAVVLMSRNPGEKTGFKKTLIPFLIFIGAGIVDTSINLLSMETEAGGHKHSIAVTLIFTGALMASIVAILNTDKRQLKDTRSLGYGFLLGIPNFFSIYAMIRALGSGVLSSNAFYMINNTGIMLLCVLLGLVLFREKLNLPRILGICLSILAIYLVLYS